MTAEEWKDRAAKHYIAKTGMSTDLAVESAEACFDNQEGDFCDSEDYKPESCVDEDLTYWAD